jgi:RHS repeat-associated protein
MNRLQDCFDDDASNATGAGPLFQGGRHDPSHDTLYLPMRDHSPVRKAWTDQDPADYVDGLNAYTAPVDEPLRVVDPLGT